MMVETSDFEEAARNNPPKQIWHPSVGVLDAVLAKKMCPWVSLT